MSMGLVKPPSTEATDFLDQISAAWRPKNTRAANGVPNRPIRNQKHFSKQVRHEKVGSEHISPLLQTKLLHVGLRVDRSWRARG